MALPSKGMLLGALTAVLLLAQDSKNFTTVPGVDFTGLSAAQKTLALKVLHSTGCPCGCGMNLVECRNMDTNCGVSKSLAAIVMDNVRHGANEAAILAALDKSPLMHRNPHKLLEDPVTIPLEDAPVRGPKTARVTVVEFSDFQCPYCAVAVTKLNALLKAYPNDVKLVFKQFPLDIHSQAALAAAAAMAAHKQGKFWQMHDAMFADRTHLTRQNILAMAGNAGLDTKQFVADWDSPAIKKAVAHEEAEGDAAGVDSTPSIFIDGRRYNGELDLDKLKPIIEAELKKK